MVDSKEYIEKIVNRKIECKFLVIEQKLRNSFQEMKKDNDSIKQKLQDIEKVFEKSNINRELSKIRESFSKETEDLNKNLSEYKRKLNLLDSKISKKDIKSEVKKEIYPLFNNKLIDSNEKQRKDIQTEIQETKDLFRDQIDTQNILIERASEKLEREFSDFKKEIEKDFSKFNRRNDRNIRKLRGEVSYLKRNRNITLKEEKAKLDIKEEKQKNNTKKLKQEKPIKKLPVSTQNKKSIFSRILDSLADEDSK